MILMGFLCAAYMWAAWGRSWDYVGGRSVGIQVEAGARLVLPSGSLVDEGLQTGFLQ